MIKKTEVCRDLKKIESRLLELKNANCLTEKTNQIQGIIDSINGLASSLTLGMTSSITGRKKDPEKCNFCGK